MKMKRLLLLLSALSLVLPANGQISSNTARHIIASTSLPSTCSPNTGDVYMLVAAGPTGTPYYCDTPNHWTVWTGGGSSVSLTGGTGISVSPNPITGAGVITNTSPGASPAGSAVTDAQCWASASTLGVCANINSNLTGTVTGHASLDLPLTGGTMVGNLLATDNTYDIGASGATRFRDLFLARNGVVGGTLSVTGLTTLTTLTSTAGSPTNGAFYYHPTTGGSTIFTEASNQGAAAIYSIWHRAAGNTLNVGAESSAGAGFGNNTAAGALFILTSNGALQLGSAFNVSQTILASGNTIFGTSSIVDAGGSQQVQVAGGVGTYGKIHTGTRFTCSGDGCTPTTGGATGGEFTTTTTGASTFVVTMGSSFSSASVNSKYTCRVSNLTTANLIRQTASNATTATFQGVTVNGDTLNFGCDGI